MKQRAEIGIVGLGTIGSNLALRVDDQGVRAALFDIDADRVRSFAREHDARAFVAVESLAELAAALERPRKILLSIPAGTPVDEAIRDLTPHLDAGDIVMDGGNSHFAETRRRGEALAARGIGFLGIGVSGGAGGARHGPSLMPGGPREAYDQVEPILEAIAAKSGFGPCVAYLGPDGAGHFVKMIHNGIEYADMQAIAEAYDVLSRGAGMAAAELAETFAEWNAGFLESFLLEIAAEILALEDAGTGAPLVESILDEAEQKGTGRWTAIAALELGVPASVIAAAVDARAVSARREERLAASRRLEGPVPRPGAREVLVLAACDALYATRICAFAQGLELVAEASREYGWDVPRADVARVWTAGSILRGRLLGPIRAALERNPSIENPLLDEDLAREIAGVQDGWRGAAAEATQRGIPVPCWSAALAWYDAVRTARLPQNLTQAQRDWFGAHRVRLLADPAAAPLHIDWVERSRASGEVPR